MCTTRTAISAIAIAALLGVCGRAGAGTISGNVSEAGTGAPIRSGFVIIYNADGTFQANAFFDSNGNFSKGGLVAGTYFARTTSTNHVDELWDNILCANNGDCSVTRGSPISVDSSGTTVVNFVLDKGGTISGTLTETTTGLPISVGTVKIFNGATGISLNDAIPDSNGNYSKSGLLAGSYFARTVDTSHIDELWDNIPCRNGGCTIASGSPISVTSSGTTTANFVLDKGATIAGTLTDSITALPISAGAVSIYNDAGISQGYVLSNIDGSYSKGGLVAGSYFARTSNTNHLDELWNDIPCALGNCLVRNGTPITVTATSTAMANFVLDKGGTISGTLTDYASGAPISSGSINFYNAGGTYIGYVVPDGNGRFAKGGLPAGTYFARTSNTNHVDELWNNISCLSACPVTHGTPITLSGNETAIANFQLANDLDGLFKNGFD